MFSVSLNDAARRGTWTCLSCSPLPWGFQAWITNSSRPLTAPPHQRKYSSSKPSNSPKDESSAIANPSEAPASEVPASEVPASEVPAKEAPAKEATAKEAKSSAKERAKQGTSSRVGRRKSKNVTPGVDKGRKEALLNLPRVPSTMSLKPQDIQVASFFSIHRPISITTPVPPPTSLAAFSKIFAPRNYKKPQAADVALALSSAIRTIENVTSHSDLQQSEPATLEDAELNTAFASSSRADPSRQQGFHINVEELARSFRPFHPPPPPIAQTPAPKIPRRKTATKQKSYSTVLTIVENIFPNGIKTYKHTTTPFREHSLKYPELGYPSTTIGISAPLLPRQPFLNHMRERQLRWEKGRKRNAVKPKIWTAISVRRQRKLKMKKHKYKKLMRRTRNLRRKLDRN